MHVHFNTLYIKSRKTNDHNIYIYIYILIYNINIIDSKPIAVATVIYIMTQFYL